MNISKLVKKATKMKRKIDVDTWYPRLKDSQCNCK